MDVNGIATYDIPAPVSSAPVSTPSVGSRNTSGSTDSTDKVNTVDVNKSSGNATLTDKQSSASLPQEVVEKAIEQINKAISTFNREMHVSMHEKTKRIMVKVMDTQENRVIREIPPEKVLDAFAKTLELAGILVDKKS